jgi:PAS domain S-box-containing protein
MKEMERALEAPAYEHVLLVDDNPINLQILQKALQGLGYELLLAKDGQSAIDIATIICPSLILLDIMMPGMNGYQVCEALKKNPVTAGVAVIFLSSLEDISAKVKGFEVGGVDYISKPFQAAEIVARVNTHIKMQRLERQLARRNIELESENQQILNTVNEGIVGLDSDGQITSLNPSATAICGWAAVDCLGQRLSTLGLFDVDDEAVPEHLTLPYRSYRMGQSTESEMELIRCRNQQLRPVAITVKPKSNGGAVMVLRDISDWVKSEDALRHAREQLELQRQNIAHIERLNTTGEMAAGIAHEVNQPLTAIANYCRVAIRLLEQDTLDRATLNELLEKVTIQSDRASQVIQRIRSYVKKPGAGSQLVDINKLIGEVITLAEVDSRINDVVVHHEPDVNLPEVTTDTVQVQQVALNLIRNAMEASAGANSTGQLLDVVVRTSLAGSAVCVEVIDQGVGVDPEDEEQLFSTFFSTKENGMGIGLSICQSIIIAMGGDIGFKRNQGRGSTFYFTLPVK